MLSEVTCDGQNIDTIQGIQGALEVEGDVRIELGSGIYQFQVQRTNSLTLSF
ncbi:hypothetical protein D3C86_1935990 [compost metagenome]